MPSSTSYDLIEACQQRGCPICRLEQRAVERYLDSLFYESVNDPKLRERLRDSLGFCREHAWLAIDKRLGNALGFAIIYRDVINNVLRKLGNENVPPVTRRSNLLNTNSRTSECDGPKNSLCAHAAKTLRCLPATR